MNAAVSHVPLPDEVPRPHRRVEVPGVVTASRLEVRPAPALAPTGVAAVDALTGGLPRGALTEVFGPASSGRTTLLVSALAQMTTRGEVCALVDATDSFAPDSAQKGGVNLRQVLWVRCGVADEIQTRRGLSRIGANQIGNQKIGNRKSSSGLKAVWPRLEQAIKATDLLLQSGGFGMVAVDLGDIPPQAARRVPLTSWFRFRRAVENTATVLLVVGRESCAKTCASLVLQLSGVSDSWSEGRRSSAVGRRPKTEPDRSRPAHGELLTGFSIRAEVIRSRLERKPMQKATAEFETRAHWA